MRELSIRRANSYVDMLATLNVYMEDPAMGDTLINGIYCRKIGELANGERKIFEIEETQAKVFAIADNARQDVCNEYYQLPEGASPVFLSGQTMIHPTDGHTFRFDQNMKIRRRMSRKKRALLTGISIVAGCLLLCAAISLVVSLIPTGEPKTFTQGDMSITLTDEFRKTEVDKWDVAYKSRDVVVAIQCEDFYLYKDLSYYSPVQYAKEAIKNSEIDATVERGPGSLTYFVFSQRSDESGITYRCFFYIYKTTDAFWIVEFCVPEGQVSRYEKTIAEWAGSVDFKQ